MTTRQTLMEIWRWVAILLVFILYFILPAEECQNDSLDYIDVLLSRIFAPIDLHDPKISPGTGMEE